MLKIITLPFKKFFSWLLKPAREIKNFSEINLKDLYSAGYRGIFLDMDNTILPRKNKLVDQGLTGWIKEALELGFKMAIVSNNFKRKRVSNIQTQLNLPTVNPAFKPLPFGFWLAAKKIDVPLKKTIVIGDQVLTDILGGKIFGGYTVLAEPLFLEKNPFRKFVQSLDAIFVKLIKKN